MCIPVAIGCGSDACMHSLTQATATILGAIVAMATISLDLTAIALFVAPVIGGLSAAAKGVVNRMEDQARDVAVRAAGVSTEAFTAAKTVKVFGMEKTFATEFRTELGEAVRLSIRSKVWRQVWKTSVIVAAVAAVTVALRRGAAAVRDGDLDPGELLSFTLYAIAFGDAASDLSVAHARLIASAVRATGAVRVLNEQARHVALIESVEQASSTCHHGDSEISVMSGNDGPDTITSKSVGDENGSSGGNDIVGGRDECVSPGRVRRGGVRTRNRRNASEATWSSDKVVATKEACSTNTTNHHRTVPDALAVACRIDFIDVQFAYAGATHNALDGVSLTLPAGKTTAVVG